MLGRTGLRVSEVGFGCGNVGGLLVRGSHETQVAVVRRALALGIDYFDTAAGYGDGLSETHLGEVLAELRPDPPDARDTRIDGAVAAGEGAQVTHSTLQGPVLIGAGAIIEDCTLGPSVVVGDGAVLRSVRLSDAMVAAGAHLEAVTHAGVVVTAANEVGA